MPTRITDLVTGGFGTLGQGVGQGVEGYLTQRDFDQLMKANRGAGQPQSQGEDPLVERVLSMARQGLSPQDVAEMLRKERGAAPTINVPGQRQGQVVQNAVPLGQNAPPSQFGGLGAQPPQAQPPMQAAPQPAPAPSEFTVGQTSPGLEAVFAAGDASRGQPRSPGTVPRDQTPIPYAESPPPQPGRPQNRVQPANPAMSPAPMAGSGGGQANALGIQGQITPRNFALAQFLAQQQRAQQETAARGQAARLEAASRVAASSQTAAGGTDRAVINALAAQAREEYKGELRANMLEGKLAQRINEFDARNQTDIWKTFMRLEGIRQQLAQSDTNSRRRDDLMKAYMQGNAAFLGRVAPFRGMDPAVDALLDKAEATQDAFGTFVGVQMQPGAPTTTPGTPGILGTGIGATPPKTTPGKPTAKIKKREAELDNL
jgi:hypothetical protein